MTIGAAVSGGLVAAIAVMWRVLYNSAKEKDRECRLRVAALESRVADIYALLVKKADDQAAKTEEREQKAWDRAMEFSRIAERVGEIVDHAIRVIRRHEPAGVGSGTKTKKAIELEPHDDQVKASDVIKRKKSRGNT